MTTESMTPGEVATHLRVSSATVRRMAAAYEAVLSPLPRDERGARRWPVKAVRQVQAAHQALGTGRVSSLERALELVRDGHDLPERVTLPVPEPDHQTGEVLAALLAEIRELCQVIALQGQELAALREVIQGRELPAPAEPMTAQAPLAPEPAELRDTVQDAVNHALDPERLRVALHASTPPAQEPRRGLLARFFRR